MDFSFSEEQTLLQDSVPRFIQNDYDFAARQKIIKGEDGQPKLDSKGAKELRRKG